MNIVPKSGKRVFEATEGNHGQPIIHLQPLFHIAASHRFFKKRASLLEKGPTGRESFSLYKTGAAWCCHPRHPGSYSLSRMFSRSPSWMKKRLKNFTVIPAPMAVMKSERATMKGTCLGPRKPSRGRSPSRPPGLVTCAPGDKPTRAVTETKRSSAGVPS